ncbi:MAG: IS630 family transposase [Acidobacteria bacterium]|nr:IS630 family transposase [Acidobacteriota bacterium]
MGNPRGVKRDFDALEARRLRAASLFKQGESQAEVARALGVHRQTVHRWAKRVEREGRAALRQAGRAGRKPRLSAVQLRRIAQELKRGPEALGYETSLWTAPRVAELIQRECGIQYHPGHVWKILRQMGWSCQRPAGRALERDEAAIRRWKKQRWPELKKKPKKKAEPSFSSMKAD